MVPSYLSEKPRFIPRYEREQTVFSVSAGTVTKRALTSHPVGGGGTGVTSLVRSTGQAILLASRLLSQSYEQNDRASRLGSEWQYRGCSDVPKGSSPTFCSRSGERPTLTTHPCANCLRKPNRISTTKSPPNQSSRMPVLCEPPFLRDLPLTTGAETHVTASPRFHSVLVGNLDKSTRRHCC